MAQEALQAAFEAADEIVEDYLSGRTSKGLFEELYAEAQENIEMAAGRLERIVAQENCKHEFIYAGSSGWSFDGAATPDAWWECRKCGYSPDKPDLEEEN